MSLALGWRLCATVILLTLPCGCSRFAVANECRRVAALVNPTLSEIDRLNQERPSTVERYTRIGQVYVDLSNELAKMQFKNGTLAGLVGDYQGLFRNAAESAQAYAQAIVAKDAQRIEMTKVMTRQLMKRERLLSKRFRNTCGSI